jgi:hypothetical protein
VLALLHDQRGSDVDHCAADCSGGLDGQIEVLDLLIDVVAVDVDGCWGNGGHLAEDCSVDELAALEVDYQRMTPSPTASKISVYLMGNLVLRSWSSLSTSLT